MFTVEVFLPPLSHFLVLIVSSGRRILHLRHGGLKEAGIGPNVTWTAIADLTVIVVVTVIVTTHVEMLLVAVLLRENVRVLMHLRPVGMSVMADVEGAIADPHLEPVPPEEEVTETEVAAQSPAIGGEIVIEMTGMIGMTETIYETSETMVMTLVL